MTSSLSTRIIEIERKEFNYGFELKDDDGPFKYYATILKVDTDISKDYGLYVGDKVISINDSTIDGRHYLSVKNIIRSSPNDRCKLEVISETNSLNMYIEKKEQMENNNKNNNLKPTEFVTRKSRNLIPSGSIKQKIRLFQDRDYFKSPTLVEEVEIENQSFGKTRSSSANNLTETFKYCDINCAIDNNDNVDAGRKSKTKLSFSNSCDLLASSTETDDNEVLDWFMGFTSITSNMAAETRSLNNTNINSQEPFEDEDYIVGLSTNCIELDIEYNTRKSLTNSKSLCKTIVYPDECLGESTDICATTTTTSTTTTTTNSTVTYKTIELCHFPSPTTELYQNEYEDDSSLYLVPTSVPTLDVNFPSASSFTNLASISKKRYFDSIKYPINVSRSSSNIHSDRKYDSNLDKVFPISPVYTSMTNLSRQDHVDQNRLNFKLKRHDSASQHIPIKLRFVQFLDKSKSKSWRDFVLERIDEGARFRKRMESSKKEKYADFVILRSDVVKFEVHHDSVQIPSVSSTGSRKFNLHNKSTSHNADASIYNQNSSSSVNSVAHNNQTKPTSCIVTNNFMTRYNLVAKNSQIKLRFYFNPNIFHDKVSSNKAFKRFKCIISVFDIHASQCLSINVNDDNSISSESNICPSYCYYPNCDICKVGSPINSNIENYERQLSCGTYNFDSISVFNSPPSNKELSQQNQPQANQMCLQQPHCSHLSYSESKENLNKEPKLSVSELSTIRHNNHSQPQLQQHPFGNSTRKCSTSISVKSGSKSSFENISNSDISGAGLQSTASTKNIINKAFGLIKSDKKTTKTYEVFTGTKQEFEEFKKQLESGTIPMELKTGETIGTHSQKFIYEVPRIKSIPKLPMIIYLCTQIIETVGLKTVGIYRKTGNRRIVKNIIENLNKPLGEIDPMTDDWNNIHAICGSLKLFLRSLKERLIPADLSHFLAYSCKTIDPDNPESLAKTLMDIRYHISSYQSLSHRRKLISDAKRCQHVVEDQLDCHWLSLQYLLAHLARVISYRSYNQMNEQATAICFAPVVMEPWQQSLEDIKADNEIIVKALELIITHQKWLFKDWDPASDNQMSYKLMEDAHHYAERFIEERKDIMNYKPQIISNNETNNNNQSDIDTNNQDDEESVETIDVREFVRETLSQSTMEFTEPRKLERRHSSHTPSQRPLIASKLTVSPQPVPLTSVSPVVPLQVEGVSDSVDASNAVARVVIRNTITPDTDRRRSSNQNPRQSQTTDALDLSVCVDLMKHVSQMTGIRGSYLIPSRSPKRLSNVMKSVINKPNHEFQKSDSIDNDAEDYFELKRDSVIVNVPSDGNRSKLNTIEDN